MLRRIRWSSLVVVLGATALMLLCLFAALRGRRFAWFGALICGAVVIREWRTLRRLESAPNRPRPPETRSGT